MEYTKITKREWLTVLWIAALVLGANAAVVLVFWLG